MAKNKEVDPNLDLDSQLFAGLGDSFEPAPESATSLGQAYLFKPEECVVTDPNTKQVRNAVVWGVPIEVRAIENGKGGFDFDVVRVQLTRATIALGREIKGSDGKTSRPRILVKPGQVVAIVVTTALQALTRACMHPTKGYEFRIQPLEKIDIGGGKTMWDYDLHVVKEVPKIKLDNSSDIAFGQIDEGSVGASNGAMARA